LVEKKKERKTRAKKRVDKERVRTRWVDERYGGERVN
jgi:hypothetical protein